MADAKSARESRIFLKVYERTSRVWDVKKEFEVQAQDDTLLSIVREKWADLDATALRCQAGNLHGKEISLQQKPADISYITDMWKKQQVPSLILVEDSCHSPVNTSPTPDILTYQGDSNTLQRRTLTGVLRDVIGDLPNPQPLPPPNMEEMPTLEEAPLSGSSPGRIRKQNTIPVMQNEQHDESDGGDKNEVFSVTNSKLMHHNSEILSQTLPSGYKYNTMSPPRRKNSPDKEKRRSVAMSMFRRSKDEEQMQELDITPPMEISGPEQREFDWRKRRVKGGVRSTLRRRTKSTPSQADLIPDLSYSFEMKTLEIRMDDYPAVEIDCREFHTIGMIREEAWMKLKTLNHALSSLDHSELVLTYQLDGRVFELFSDQQFLFQTAIYKSWAQNDKVTHLCAEQKEHTWELPTLHRLCSLTGVLLDEDVRHYKQADISKLAAISPQDRPQFQWARRTLQSYMAEVVHERDAEIYALSMEIEYSEAPTLLTLKIPLDNKVEITFHYETSFSLVRRVKVTQYACSVLRDVFACVLACDLVEDDIDKYTLQVSGEESYLDGNNELITFKDIRRCVLKGDPIHLSVARKPSVECDKLCPINWLPIDPCSRDSPLHTDISRERELHAQGDVIGLSTWDQMEEFSIVINSIDNLPVPSSSSKKFNIVVEAQLYHANSELVPKMATPPISLPSSRGQLTVQQPIMLPIRIRDLPKAAKLLLILRDGSMRKDSSVKKKPQNLFYWGLVSVFDHKGVLQTGSYTMTLWKGPSQPSKLVLPDGQVYPPNPCSPGNSNPDNRAIKVTVLFPRHSYPVFFPSSGPETHAFLLSQETDSQMVKKQFQRLMECIRDEKLPLSTLPGYIAKINWGKLDQVVEVYSLLQQMEAEKSLPIETALRLLDCEFADEHVRTFAVKMLDTLSDEQLEDFLIQLAQALKFEAYHDSALARLLLRRGLRNKRLGHFLFWYLKCEMYNPLYTPRFAVLLEAYLKGCGEAMLTRFENQVIMQQCLEEIGKQVEQRGSGDSGKMQALLQELLQANDIPEKQLTPVYNPRLVLGKLNPIKCKIMASKKKPQWLEMRSISPTAIKSVPTRLILKQGDDLRQDMITLKMFSLFQKLWEKDGLPNLCLIPYGCMATSPKTGFIEVVKSARTIAEVSAINNKTNLFEWIKSHQKNEFGEDDPEKLSEAIRRFTLSCAGYTVATYVLGIGDRHNDNIMITTEGNLFHIDFGHFLGNIKYFMGFKREWAPFVLTPDFVYVMGGEGGEMFNLYKKLCCRAFLTLRRHHELIVNLFAMMRSTGIPELTCVEDVDYISHSLVYNKSDIEAESDFQQLIQKCIDLGWTVQIMWWIHIRKKGGNSS